MLGFRAITCATVLVFPETRFRRTLLPNSGPFHVAFIELFNRDMYILFFPLFQSSIVSSRESVGLAFERASGLAERERDRSSRRERRSLSRSLPLSSSRRRLLLGEAERDLDRERDRRGDLLRDEFLLRIRSCETFKSISSANEINSIQAHGHMPFHFQFIPAMKVLYLLLLPK